jgi:hypothetical protein
MRLGIALFLAMALRADTLGYVEQKFTDLHFEKGKWASAAGSHSVLMGGCKNST